MRKNSKGFIAISTVYTFFIVFMMLLILVIVTYANNRYSFDPYKTNIKTKLLGKYESFSSDISFINNRVQKEATTSRTGAWKVYNEYGGNRYEGLGPDNYVCFGTEAYPCPVDNIYRIVGSFTNAVHGISGKTLVKVVKQTPIGDHAYASPEDLIEYLETTFYNKLDDPKEGGLDTRTTNYKAMIEEVWWYYEPISPSVKAADAYNQEHRSSTSNKKKSHVGLLNASDYGLSAIANGNVPSGATISCTRNVTLDKYRSGGVLCHQYTWLNKEMWLLNKSNAANQNLYINDEYNVVSGDSSLTKDLYPSFYLNEKVYIVDGNGSLGSPYTLNLKSEA